MVFGLSCSKTAAAAVAHHLALDYDGGNDDNALRYVGRVAERTTRIESHKRFTIVSRNVLENVVNTKMKLTRWIWDRKPIHKWQTIRIHFRYNTNLLVVICYVRVRVCVVSILFSISDDWYTILENLLWGITSAAGTRKHWAINMRRYSAGEQTKHSRVHTNTRTRTRRQIRKQERYGRCARSEDVWGYRGSESQEHSRRASLVGSTCENGMAYFKTTSFNALYL